MATPPGYWATVMSSLNPVEPATNWVVTELTDVPAVALPLDGAAALGAAGVPTVVVQGTEDAVVNASVPAMLKQRYDGAKSSSATGLHIVSLAGWGHFFYPGEPPSKNIFQPALAEFGRHFGHDGDAA